MPGLSQKEVTDLAGNAAAVQAVSAPIDDNSAAGDGDAIMRDPSEEQMESESEQEVSDGHEVDADLDEPAPR